jgi:hypothetical protein
MEMNAPERPEVLRETDHVKKRRGDPGVGVAPQDFRPDEPTPPRDLRGPHVPDEDDSEPLVGGAGI